MNSANSNTFTYAADSALARFAAFAEADANCGVCVVGTAAPTDAVRTAITASFERLGYGAGSVGWVWLEGGEDIGEEATAAGESSTTATGSLSDEDLYFLAESLDPLVFVTTDARATDALARIYRTTLPYETVTRLLGRPTLAFRDFAGLLQTQPGKQQAWAALKKLARK